MLPLVGFISADDPRMRGTVAAIEDERVHDGLVYRYPEAHQGSIDGLSGGEGAFLPCSFWLADNYVLQGRVNDGRKLFDQLLGRANDLGLLSEEYDPDRNRLMGNFPQAFTHVGLVNTAHNLRTHRGPARTRGEEQQ